MDNWLNDCKENLNAVVFDNLTAEILTFSAKRTINIPPYAEYTKKKRRPHRGKLDDSDSDEKNAAKGFEAENVVRKCFGTFGPGGIYLSGLKIMPLVSDKYSKNCLKRFLPDDAPTVHEYLSIKENAGIEIDGLFIHPKIGLAVIEIKAASKSWISGQAIKQLGKIVRFINGLYRTIFGEDMYIPVHKVACTPNATCKLEIDAHDGIDILDQQILCENDGTIFTSFWHTKMHFVDRTEGANFTKFAAVLISLKTAFGLVCTFNSNIMAKTHRMIVQHESLFDATKKVKHQPKCGVSCKCPATVEMGPKSKQVFFWINNDQLEVLEASAGQHFINGVPGSGKSLLLKARVLTFISNPDRTAIIFCPTALTHQYLQFVDDNGLKDRVKVKSFLELSKIAIMFNNKPEKFKHSEYAEFLFENVDIYCDEMDFNTLVKPNLHFLLKERPKLNAETFIVGESPEIAGEKNIISEMFELAATNFSRHTLKTMMRNSKEIMSFYKKEFDPDIVLGHSISMSGLEPPKECQNRRVVLSEVVKNVRFLLKRGYNYSDLAVISIGIRKQEIEYALRLSNIETKKIADNFEGVPVLAPVDVKSYEWKAVIIAIDYDHEQELPLAVSRATTELIIVKDMAYEQTIREIKSGICKPPEEILLKYASPDRFEDIEKIYCHAYPYVKHYKHKPIGHCENVEEFRKWSIYGELQECGYSSKNLLRLSERVKFEQENKFEEQINKRKEIARPPQRDFAYGTLRKSDQLHGSNTSLQEFSTSAANFDSDSKECDRPSPGKSGLYRTASNLQLNSQHSLKHSFNDGPPSRKSTEWHHNTDKWTSSASQEHHIKASQVSHDKSNFSNHSTNIKTAAHKFANTIKNIIPKKIISGVRSKSDSSANYYSKQVSVIKEEKEYDDHSDIDLLENNSPTMSDLSPVNEHFSLTAHSFDTFDAIGVDVSAFQKTSDEENAINENFDAFRTTDTSLTDLLDIVEQVLQSEEEELNKDNASAVQQQHKLVFEEGNIYTRVAVLLITMRHLKDQINAVKYEKFAVDRCSIVEKRWLKLQAQDKRLEKSIKDKMGNTKETTVVFEDVATEVRKPPQSMIEYNDDQKQEVIYPRAVPRKGAQAIALYDYQAADDEELSLEPNDIICNIEQIHEGWWRGQGPNGKVALFPSNYVRMLD